MTTRTLAKIALYLASVTALAFAGDIAYGARYAQVMAAAAGSPPATWTWTDIAAIVGVIGAFLGVVSTALHIIAPRTKTTIDDKLVARIDGARAFLGSPEFAQILAAWRDKRQDATLVQMPARAAPDKAVMP